MRARCLLPCVLLYSFSFALLTGCASTPEFDTTDVDRSLTPQGVIAESDFSLDKVALWGGTIIETRNLENGTRIEVLAYPLNTYEKPLLDRQPLGRFLILHPDYLEPANYASGRLVTVSGKVIEIQSGKIGDSDYRYPVISSRQIHLWSRDTKHNRSNTSFHFGVGIGL